MIQLIRAAGWILFLAVAIPAGLVAVFLLSAGIEGGLMGQSLLALVGVAVAFVLSAASGALLIGFADLIEDVRAIRSAQNLLLNAEVDSIGISKKGSIGAHLKEVKDGFEVTVVEQGSRAEIAGLKRGDTIIAVDNQALSKVSSREDRIALFTGSGERKLNVLRNGEVRTVRVNL